MRPSYDLSILRVLLIEGDAFARELEKTAFMHLGVKSIDCATDENAALETLQRGARCDLLALDWNRAMSDARSLVEKLRAARPDAPVLIFTTNWDVNPEKMARAASADACLVKPFSLDALREAVQRALTSRLSERKARSRTAKPSEELQKVIGSVREVLDQRLGSHSDKVVSAAEMKNIQAFTAGLLKQLNGFVTTAHTADPVVLDVIQLHVDCLRAIMNGRGVLLDHEDRNIIVDGLALAAAMTKQ